MGVAVENWQPTTVRLDGNSYVLKTREQALEFAANLEQKIDHLQKISDLTERRVQIWTGLSEKYNAFIRPYEVAELRDVEAKAQRLRESINQKQKAL
jgi:hypothetical protein